MTFSKIDQMMHIAWYSPSDANSSPYTWQVQINGWWYSIDYWYGEGIEAHLTEAWFLQMNKTFFIATKDKNDGTEYKVNFEKWQQKNMKTKNKRLLRVIPRR